MKKSIFSKLPMIAAGVAAPLLGLTGCGMQQEGPAVSTKSQDVLLSPPRQHYEVVDPQDGMFVSYWERYYDRGDASMDLRPNGYRTDVNYTAMGLPTDTNSVSGKGGRQCWGDVIDWTVVSQSGSPFMHVYGWLESPLVEYYIGRGEQYKGSMEARIHEYNTPTQGRWALWVVLKEQENVVNPDGTGPIKKFLQYNVEPLDGQDPQIGPVNLGEHFAAWEPLMQAFWDDPLNDAFFRKGSTDPWIWNEFTKANYCIVATEMFGHQAGHVEISNLTVIENATQMVDGSCNGVDNDGDGSVDEDWIPGFCILPPSHPTCGDGKHYGTTVCSGTAETCVPNAGGTPDICDGLDNDCDGVTDENFIVDTRDCGTEVGLCQNKETSSCAGIGGEVWGSCQNGPDPIPEEACNGVDDDCDGVTDEGSINLPVKCVLDRDDDGIEDGIDTQPDTYSDDFAETNFGNTTGEIVDRGDQIVVVLNPFSDEGVWVETLPGGGAEEAEISLCGGTITLSMGPGENQVVTCPETSCLFASEQLKIFERGEVWSDFYAGNFIMNTEAKVYAKGLATGNGNLIGSAKITGGATLGGTLSGNRAGAAPLVEHAAVARQVLTVFSIVSSGSNVPVPDNQTVTLSPGDYGDVTVGHNATLVLNASGTYRFRSLTTGNDAKLNLTAAAANLVAIAIQGNVALGDRFKVLGSAELDIYANGTSVVLGFDIIPALNVDIHAPFAHVEFKDRTRLNGCVGGRNVTLGANTQVHGEVADPGPGPGPQPPLTFWQTKTNDWGGDYCIQVGANNPGTVAVDWIITINTNGSTITNNWNASFSGASGTVTANPNQSYNLVIDAGETDTTVGFCAHRNAPGQTATVVSVAAQ